MTRREQAIEAASEALHADNCPEGDEHDGCDCADWEREAEVALTAALAVLQPTIPNSAEALDQLPDGAVIRGHGHLGLPVVAEKDGGRWYTAGGQTCDSQSVTEYPCGKWTVLWPVAEPEWTGRIVGGEFSLGDDGRGIVCANCSCDCHDNPRPAGTYLTIRLDADSASIRPAHVTIQEKP